MSSPLSLSGYVLAGGRSSRMGTDKALLQLAGRSLAAHAVETISTLCERVRIVGTQPEVRELAQTVQDDFVGCGPLGGIEAAIRDTPHDWILILPVDLPFLPRNLLYQWAQAQRRIGDETVRVSYLEAGGRPQPLIALLHRSLLCVVQTALRAEQYRMMRVYEDLAQALAPTLGVAPEMVVQRAVLHEDGRLLCGSGAWIPWTPTRQDIALHELWFGNLNTPEEFSIAEARLRELQASK